MYIGQNSVGSTKTHCGLDGLGFEIMEVRFSVPIQTGPGAHPASCAVSARFFLWVKQAGHRHCASYRSSSAVPPLPLCAFMTYYRVDFNLYSLCRRLGGPQRRIKPEIAHPIP